MRPYDPRYPRILTRSQAYSQHFGEALIERAVRGVEAVMNAHVNRSADVPPLGATGHRCDHCGATTYGYALECGRCGYAR